MGWRPYQQTRLAQEKAYLRQYLPGFEFFNPLADTYVSGWWTSNLRRQYEIRVHLPESYPDAPPDTYVSYPTPLLGYRSLRTIESWRTSHVMHTWESDRPGWTRICIVRPEHWSADFSIVKVLRKSMLWITAYECHLDDGRMIREFLIDG